MGVLDKVKQWFEDEEEEIVSSKSKVEIAAPKTEETEEVEKTETNEIADTKALKAEEKPSSVIFDDKDFEEINNTESVKAAKKSYANRSKKEKEKEKGFRPTPIISPVYGILDKNYAKDDVTPKKNIKTKDKQQPEDTGSIDLDWIRKKAYGNLDDDLEKEILNERHVLVDEKFVEEKELFDNLKNKEQELFENLKTNQNVEQPTAEKPEASDDDFENFTTDENYDKIEDPENDETKERMLEDSFFYEKRHQEEAVVEDNSVEEKEEPQVESRQKRNGEKKTDEDLFNLIDTMYEKGEDE